MTLGIGSALISCAPVLADWELVSDTAVLQLSGPSVRTSDPRGNSFLMQKDAAGKVTGYLLVNAFLPEPDPVGVAAPVVFNIDGKDMQVIKEGKWERTDLYRKLVFTLSEATAFGLSEPFIDILEGGRITFRYPAGSVGYETVSFSLNDPGGAVARTLDVEVPVDHDKQRVLRESHRRMEAERKAQLLNPVDAVAERARRTLIDSQLNMIRTRVMDRWMMPARWSGLRCTLQITLMSTGKVLQVAVIKSSGDPEFDASMATAVRDASPLPLPVDKTLFGSFQQLEMVFDPAVETGGTFSKI